MKKLLKDKEFLSKFKKEGFVEKEIVQVYDFLIEKRVIDTKLQVQEGFKHSGVETVEDQTVYDLEDIKLTFSGPSVRFTEAGFAFVINLIHQDLDLWESLNSDNSRQLHPDASPLITIEKLRPDAALSDESKSIINGFNRQIMLDKISAGSIEEDLT
jgi:hypothetical protein